MHPLLTVLVTVAVFTGMVVSYEIGYRIVDWTNTIFSYRPRVTDTHLILERPEPRVIHNYLTPNEIRGMKWGVREYSDDHVIGDDIEKLTYKLKEY